MRIFTPVAIACLTIPFSLLANPANPPLRRTGAPGEGSCRECHTAAVTNAGAVVVVFDHFSYTPGQTMGIKVLLRTAQTASQTAIQMTARLASNPLLQAGHFSTQSPLGVYVDNGVEYVNQAVTSNATEYTFQWTPPAASVGDVLFYVAAAAGESNGAPEGNIYQGTFRLRTGSADLPTGLRSTDFTIPGVTGNIGIYPGGISNNGQVTGRYYDGTSHGFLRQTDGTVVTFSGPSADFSPAAINNAGRIVGSFVQNEKTSGFIREPSGVIAVFDVPGATSTALSGINDAGLITGSFVDSANVQHGFTMTTPNNLQIFDVSTSTFVSSVSSTGVIGGTIPIGQLPLGSLSGGFLRFPDGSVTVALDPCVSGSRGGGTFALYSNAAQTVAGNCGASSSGMVFQTRFLQAANGRSLVQNVSSGFPYYGGINDAGQLFTTSFTDAGTPTAQGTILTPCAANPAGTAFNAPATSGVITIPVTSPDPTCRAVAAGGGDFFSIASSTAAGVSVFVAENTSTLPRTARIWVAGSDVTITQAGAPCVLTLTGGPATFNSLGGTGTITVTAGCAWNVASNVPWITLTGVTSGNGSGAVAFSVAVNSAQSVRNGAILFGSQQFSIIQTGAQCVYTVTPQSLQFPSTGGSLTVNVASPDACPWSVLASDPWIIIPPGNASRSGNGSFAVTVQPTNFSTRIGTVNVAGTIITVQQTATANAVALKFVPVAPCRVADTRADGGKSGAFGPPILQAGESRAFPLPSSGCGIPSTARAYSLNVTVVPRGPLSYLSAWPTGTERPLVSTLNSFNGRVVANAAIVPAGTGGSINIFVTDSTDVVIDINGYFATQDEPQGLAFYPVTPCRVTDTRSGQSPIAIQTSRSFNVQNGGCGIPATAKAYAMNATAIPPAYLGFITLWPTGQPRPNASTLNSWDGQVVANMAIVPAGANGDVSVYASNDTDVVLDITGYFAPAGQPGALNFYTRPPCRIIDTRNTSIVPGQTSRSFTMSDGGCVPAEAKAYSVNVTAVPPGYLGFLTMWPTGVAQPFVSTLNSWNGQVVANAALVPAGTGGAVSIYVSNPSHVVIDANGYFAP